MSSFEVPTILVRLERSLNFLDRFSFERYTNIKFHENPSSPSRVVPCGRTDRQANMANHIVAFRNFANAPKLV